MYQTISSFPNKQAIKRFKRYVNNPRLFNIFIVLVMLFSSSDSKAVSAAPHHPEDDILTSQDITDWWEAAGMHFPKGAFFRSPLKKMNSSL